MIFLILFFQKNFTNKCISIKYCLILIFFSTFSSFIKRDTKRFLGHSIKKGEGYKIDIQTENKMTKPWYKHLTNGSCYALQIIMLTSREQVISDS